MTGRVAIYATPGAGTADADGALLRERAETWLGRRADGSEPGAELPDGWSREEIDALTVDARRYGFHGTLKAPFRLAPGRTLDELQESLSRFGATRAAVLLPQLALRRIGDFFALVPGAEAHDLHDLADALVTGFDDFRAPATAADIARRNPDALTERQRQRLQRWGYPYVLDELRFHLTLTDRIPAERQPAVEETLYSWFAPFLGRAVAIDTLLLFTESEPGAPFRLHSASPLRPLSGLPSTEALDHEGTR